jgi:hypothetical protein
VNFRDLRHGQTGVDHLLDPSRTLSVGEITLVVVGDHLVHDAVDRFSGGIGCGGGQQVDRHGAQTELARCPLRTYLHRTVVVANRSEGTTTPRSAMLSRNGLFRFGYSRTFSPRTRLAGSRCSRVPPSGACASSWWSVPYWGPAAAL